MNNLGRKIALGAAGGLFAGITAGGLTEMLGNNDGWVQPDPTILIEQQEQTNEAYYNDLSNTNSRPIILLLGGLGLSLGAVGGLCAGASKEQIFGTESQIS